LHMPPCVPTACANSSLEKEAGAELEIGGPRVQTRAAAMRSTLPPIPLMLLVFT
jgi:hypothetical protein